MPRKVSRRSYRGGASPDARESIKSVQNKKRGTVRNKSIQTGTFGEADSNKTQAMAVKMKSKGKGGQTEQGFSKGKTKIKYKTVKADGTVKKTTVARKSGKDSFTTTERTKNVGTKRAGKMISRAKAKQSRMDKKAARKPRNPAMGRDIPLPKSK
jgi:hypothetical protein